MRQILPLVIVSILIICWQVDANPEKKRPHPCNPKLTSRQNNKKESSRSPGGLIAITQSQPVPSTDPNQSTASSTPSTGSNAQSESKDNRIIKNVGEGFKTIAEGSRALNAWALMIIAASIIALVSTSYIRPVNRNIRKFYLLFIPAWLLVSVSMYFGDQISRRYVAALMASREDTFQEIGSNINSDFAYQILFLQFGLLVFAVWLLFFLLWWVFGNWSVATIEVANLGLKDAKQEVKDEED